MKQMSSAKKIHYVLIGFVLFAIVESLLCVFFSGKYWLFYAISGGSWVFFGLIFSAFSLLFFSVWGKFKKNLTSGFFLAYSLALPLLFYTLAQLAINLPGKYWSPSNLGMVGVFALIFLFLFFVIYKVWAKRPDRARGFKDYVMMQMLIAATGLSGVFLVISPLQKEHWLVSVILVFLFCVLLPFFFLLVFLKIPKGFFGQIFIFSGLILALFLVELHVLCPVRDQLVFRQAEEGTGEDVAPAKFPQNIILIVMDTTRAANMSLYGYERNTTHNLEAFSEDSVTYQHLISNSPWTLPSHSSLFTGFPSDMHGATHGKTTDEPSYPLHDIFETLAEIFSAQGYATGAVVANTAYLAPWTGLNQGFQFYWWGRPLDHVLLLSILGSMGLSKNKFIELKKLCGIEKLNSAQQINQVAIRWMKKVKEKPFFLFLNYMENHGMNYLPSPYSTMFTSPPAPFFTQRKETGIPTVEKGQLERFRSWYDNELASLDFQIGALFAKLKNMGIYDRSLVVVTSDHGELLGEHDDFGHEFWLYQELLHVPLLVKAPFQKNGGTVRMDVVQIIDVFAELLTQAGIELPPFTQGQPFDEVDHPIIAEVKRNPDYVRSWPKTYDRDLTALFAKPFPGLKLIQSTEGGSELYDLKKDPGELKKITDVQNIQMLEEKLNNYLDYLDQLEIKKLRTRIKRIMDKATLDRLRDLGYIK